MDGKGENGGFVVNTPVKGRQDDDPEDRVYHV